MIVNIPELRKILLHVISCHSHVFESCKPRQISWLAWLVCRDPLKKAPEQIPGEQPARRGDEQTQPQPGEAQASAPLSEEEMQDMELRAEHDVQHIAEAHE